jgi:hypothetical protein
MCQNGRNARDIAREFRQEEVLALVDAEIARRRRVDLADVSVKTTSEWNIILKAKIENKK